MAPASPMRPDFVAAAQGGDGGLGPGADHPLAGVGRVGPMWYRAVGVPSYGASASMMKDSDEFAHGLNERISLINIRPGITYYLSMYKDLASK
jgi:acetylornithine deacetylase/succinyl-diaminopimelate desuccinylase-like protein